MSAGSGAVPEVGSPGGGSWMPGPLRALSAAWNGSFFAPRSAATVALVRVAFGAVAAAWTVSLVVDLGSFFTDDGILPAAPTRSWAWSLFDLASSPAVVWAVWAATLVAAVCLALGIAPRFAAWVVFFGILSFERRNPYVINSGDLVLRHLAFLVALAPTESAFTLPQVLRGSLRFPARAQWPLRLIQLMLSFGYLSAVWEKAQGSTWSDGTAVGIALRIGDLVRFPAPRVFTEWAVVTNLLTWSTLAVELALGLLVWNRRLRPWVLGAGVLFHLGIDLTIEVGFFSYAILVGYLAFVPPDVAERLLTAAAARLRPRRASTDAAVRVAHGPPLSTDGSVDATPSWP